MPKTAAETLPGHLALKGYRSLNLAFAPAHHAVIWYQRNDQERVQTSSLFVERVPQQKLLRNALERENRTEPMIAWRAFPEHCKGLPGNPFKRTRDTASGGAGFSMLVDYHEP